MPLIRLRTLTPQGSRPCRRRAAESCRRVRDEVLLALEEVLAELRRRDRAVLDIAVLRVAELVPVLDDQPVVVDVRRLLGIAARAGTTNAHGCRRRRILASGASGPVVDALGPGPKTSTLPVLLRLNSNACGRRSARTSARGRGRRAGSCTPASSSGRRTALTSVRVRSADVIQCAPLSTAFRSASKFRAGRPRPPLHSRAGVSARRDRASTRRAA